MTLTTLEHFAAIPNTRNGEVTLFKPLKNALAHARPRTFPSQQMRMQMINFLSAPRAGIDHGSKTCTAGVRAALRHAVLRAVQSVSSSALIKARPAARNRQALQYAGAE